MTDSQLETLFREWWLESYPIPPHKHALMTHLAWGRHLLNKIEYESQQPKQD
jgi:hypothetical protein